MPKKKLDELKKQLLEQLPQEGCERRQATDLIERMERDGHSPELESELRKLFHGVETSPQINWVNEICVLLAEMGI